VTPLVVSVLIFAAVALFAATMLLTVFSEERKVTRALRTVSDWESQQAAITEPTLRPFRDRILAPAADAASRMLRGALPEQAKVAMQHRLDLAGNPGKLTPEGVTGLRVMLAAAAFVACIIGFTVARTGLTAGSVLGTLAVTAFAAILPALWLDSLRKRRQDAIRRALPDMLDMLSISVQAGLGFDTALAKLIRTTTGPLPFEFSRMLREVQAGVTRRDAFRHLGDRTDVAELNNFIVAMVQADVFGVSISTILRTQSVELRKKRRAKAEEEAQKAPVKIVFPIILCILPATLLVILGPVVAAIAKMFGGS